MSALKCVLEYIVFQDSFGVRWTKQAWKTLAQTVLDELYYRLLEEDMEPKKNFGLGLVLVCSCFNNGRKHRLCAEDSDLDQRGKVIVQARR